MASQKDKKIIYRKIKDYIKVARENGFDIWRVYLFGSYATGRFTANSDIDLAVFLNTNVIDGFSEDAYLMKLTRKVDLRIEPHSFAKMDFDDPDPFVKEIVTKGERVL
jgi:predicted nucleotidyltransferase